MSNHKTKAELALELKITREQLRSARGKVDSLQREIAKFKEGTMSAKQARSD